MFSRHRQAHAQPLARRDPHLSDGDGDEPMSGDDIRCQELVELVTAHLDDALDTRTRQRLEKHLHDCDACHSYLHQFRATVDTIAAIEDLPIDNLRTRLLAAFSDTA